jgi:hypothetical protein
MEIGVFTKIIVTFIKMIGRKAKIIGGIWKMNDTSSILFVILAKNICPCEVIKFGG